MLATIRLH